MIVSSGTLRPQDLLEAFAQALEERSNSNGALVSEAYELANLLERDDYYRDPNTVRYVLNDLFDALNDVAPTGYYFGASESDGALFGFWEEDE